MIRKHLKGWEVASEMGFFREASPSSASHFASPWFSAFNPCIHTQADPGQGCLWRKRQRPGKGWCSVLGRVGRKQGGKCFYCLWRKRKLGSHAKRGPPSKEIEGRACFWVEKPAIRNAVGSWDGNCGQVWGSAATQESREAWRDLTLGERIAISSAFCL